MEYHHVEEFCLSNGYIWCTGQKFYKHCETITKSITNYDFVLLQDKLTDTFIPWPHETVELHDKKMAFYQSLQNNISTHSDDEKDLDWEENSGDEDPHSQHDEMTLQLCCIVINTDKAKEQDQRVGELLRHRFSKQYRFLIALLNKQDE